VLRPARTPHQGAVKGITSRSTTPKCSLIVEHADVLYDCLTHVNCLGLPSCLLPWHRITARNHSTFICKPLSLVVKERKKYEAIVRELGSEALERNDVTITWQQRVTHLAMPALIRSQQVCQTSAKRPGYYLRLGYAMSRTL